MSHFELCGVSREATSDGAYRLVAPAGRLAIATRTITLSTVAGAPLLHAPLSSCLFGVSADKLMIVPASRAPAWALRLQPADCAQLASTLRASGCVLERAAGTNAATLTTPTDADLLAAATAPGFADLVAQMESALGRRQGLPDLLA